MVVVSAVSAWTWYGFVARFVHAIEAAITVEPNYLLTAGQIAAKAPAVAAADIRDAAVTRSIADSGAD